MSGRRESNPVYIHPMDAYYRHTPARSEMSCVGPPGIEPGLNEPESFVLPVYYGPKQNTSLTQLVARGHT
jgi:hypothetical protein